MLDKSVPYQPIIMKLDYIKNEFRYNVVLPKGFHFQMYEPGLEQEWAKTEALILEFDSKEKALEYFRKDLLPYQSKLKERMVFILNQEGIAVANACAWYINYKGIHQAHVHYVGVRPKYQGLGLGRAIIMKMLTLFPRVEPREDIYLHTQTWSHVAILIYLKMGFRMIKDDTIGYHEKNYEEAVKVLETIFDSETMSLIKGKA